MLTFWKWNFFSFLVEYSGHSMWHQFQVSNTVIEQICTQRYAHHRRGSLLSPYVAVTVSLPIFLLLCLLYPWLPRSITRDLYPLNSFCPTSYPPALPGTISIFLCIYTYAILLFGFYFFFCFQISLRNETTWYLPFSVWLISLGTIPSRSIHVVSNGRISSFFMAA